MIFHIANKFSKGWKRRAAPNKGIRFACPEGGLGMKVTKNTDNTTLLIIHVETGVACCSWLPTFLPLEHRPTHLVLTVMFEMTCKGNTSTVAFPLVFLANRPKTSTSKSTHFGPCLLGLRPKHLVDLHGAGGRASVTNAMLPFA